MSGVIVPIVLVLASAIGGSAFYGAPVDTIPLITFSAGAFDPIENNEQDQAVDFRADYRFGDALFWNMKPFIGIEATSDGGGGAFTGLLADFVFDKHWVVTPSFGVGLWGNGGGKDMGSIIEFRTQLEAGYKFDNDWRLTGSISHMSNADIGDENPGAETLMVNLSIPASTIWP